MNLPHPTRADLLLIIPWIVGALVLFFGALSLLMTVSLTVYSVAVDPATLELLAGVLIIVIGGGIGGYYGTRIYAWRRDDVE